VESGGQHFKLVGEFCLDDGDFLANQFGKVVLNICQDLVLKCFGSDSGVGQCSDGSGFDVRFLGCSGVLIFGWFWEFGVLCCIEIKSAVVCSVVKG